MKSLLVLMFTVVAFNVSANDSAVPKIAVKGIDPMGNFQGTSFRIYGGNTADFFEMLPGIAVAESEYNQKLAQKYRHLLVESKGWALDIYCNKNENVQNGIECRFDLNKKDSQWEDYGDSFDWAPRCSGAK